MDSTFHAFEIGRRTLGAHQTALDTTSHNLSRASDPNYSRQIVDLAPAPPLHANKGSSPGDKGQGVKVENIRRIRDTWIDNRILAEQHQLGEARIRHNYLQHIQSFQNEPNGINIRTVFDNFIQSWNDLANAPSSTSTRIAVQQAGFSLTENIRGLFSNYTSLQKDANSEIVDVVKTINARSQEIAALNTHISKAESLGNTPGDLLDTRDAKIRELAEYVPIHLERNKAEFIVYLGNQHLVQGNKSMKISLEYEANGMAVPSWKKSQRPLYVESGKLSGLITMRDKDLVSHLQDMNNFSATLINTVNNVHQKGMGNNFKENLSFFDTHPQDARGIDNNNDGLGDQSSIFNVVGNEILRPSTTINIQGTITLNDGINVPYYASDHVNEVIDRINRAQGGIVSHLDLEGHLSIRALPSNDPKPVTPLNINDLSLLNRQSFQTQNDQLGQSGRLVVSSVSFPYAAQETVGELIGRVNNRLGGNVVALNPDGKIATLGKSVPVDGIDRFHGRPARPDFAIGHLADSGSFLTSFAGILKSSGPDGSFSFLDVNGRDKFQQNDTPISHTPFHNPAQWIRLSTAVAESPASIAAAGGIDADGDGYAERRGGAGDGLNALRVVASLTSSQSPRHPSLHKVDHYAPMLDADNRDFSAFLSTMVAKTGQQSRELGLTQERGQQILASLKEKQQSFSGVNTDEEVARMLMYQNGYLAGTRIIRMTSKMIETIINLI